MISDDELQRILNIGRGYKAKSGKQEISVYSHVMDLEEVRKSIKDIFGIDNELNKNLKIANLLHDIGKIIKFFQDNMETRNRTIRHEILSASIVDIDDNVRLAILTSHRSLEIVRANIEKKEYSDELNEMEGKLSVKLKDIKRFIDYCISGQGDELTKDIKNILLKGYLNYCDHLASAGILKLDRGLNTIKDFKIPGKVNTIQKKVLELKRAENIIIKGMTGVGKTAAAMFWSDLVQNKEKSKRIYYLLPYTASINAKFIELDEMGLSVAMMHGRAEYFLDNYDSRINYDVFKKSVKQITITTIFQLIKIIFSCKNFEMILSQMKNSIFIIDEIHSFDVKELCYILELLRWLKEKLGIKICVMSASIPTSTLEVIKNRLGIKKIIMPEKEDHKIRHGIVRKKKRLLDDLSNIEKEIKEKKKVLICVNSVNLAQNLYKYFKDKFPELKENIKIIHGRFSARDRKKSEERIGESKLLIGTQAIEVSLNIDFDILFTELAPIDALIQRFGRINRFGKKDIGYIFIYDGENKIYKKEILERTSEVLEEIIKEDKGIILEEKIQYYLDKVYEKFDYEEYSKYKELIEDIISELKVGSYSSIVKKIIEKDTMGVIPKTTYGEYIELIEKKRFLEAESLKVSIRNSKIKDNGEYDRKHKIYIVNYKYTEELGLEFEKIE